MAIEPSAVPADLAQALRTREPLFWVNDRLDRQAVPSADGAASVLVASQRFARAAPLLARLFPELAASGGHLRSPLRAVPHLQCALGGTAAQGQWLVKQDHLLPVAGSIKARGGFHEVLMVAEGIAADQGLDLFADELGEPALSDMRALFSRHTVSVGSTGNLGLGIGLIAAALGFKTVVHMSAEAKAWKKDRLRARGIEVVEHQGDYGQAVAAGRCASLADPAGHFVDDENSMALFMGYAAAAREVVDQLHELGRPPGVAHPLFVYLPCGVGGAPGGITYGLKQLLGEHVHCFFAEPVASPAMLAQLASTGAAPVSVYDLGLDNVTEADGLAVPQASPLVNSLAGAMISGVFTVDDASLFRNTCLLAELEQLMVEPSAAAGVTGPPGLLGSEAGRQYLADHGLSARMDQATHVVWTTGGSLVPAGELAAFQAQGRRLLGR